MKPTSRFSAAAVLLLTCAIAPVARGASQCYYPSGSKSSDVPCDPDAAVSMCCGSVSACLSSGLCLISGTGPNEGISFARGTCTDKDWNSPICPQQCQINPDAANNASAYNFGTGGVQVWECVGQGYAEPGAYCCESRREKTECCRTQSAVFSLRGASIGNALAVQTYLPDLKSDTTDSITTNKPTTAGTSRTEAGESSDTVATTGTDRRSTVIASTELPTTSRLSNLPTQTTTNSGAAETEVAVSGGMGDAAKIGMGIGIGVGAAVLIAAALFMWYWMRKRAAVGAAAASSSGDYYSTEGKPELHGRTAPVGGGVKELYGHDIYEMQASERHPAEVDAVGGARNSPNLSELHGLGEHTPVEMYAGRLEPQRYR